MAKSITIHSPEPSGGSVAVTVDLTGPASALITIRNYASPNPPNNAVPTRSEAHGVVDIKLNSAGTGIKCHGASFFGPIGDVTCDLRAGQGETDRSVSIVIANTHLFDRVMSFRLNESDYRDLLKFLNDAAFPKG